MLWDRHCTIRNLIHLNLFVFVSDKARGTRPTALTVPELPDVGVVLLHNAVEPAPPEKAFMVKSDVLYLRRRQMTRRHTQVYYQACYILIPVIPSGGH